MFHGDPARLVFALLDEFSEYLTRNCTFDHSDSFV